MTETRGFLSQMPLMRKMLCHIPFALGWLTVFGVLALAGCQEPTLKPGSSRSPTETPSIQKSATLTQAREIPLVDSLATRPGSDWSGFLGPSGDGKSPEKGIKAWPKSGPKVVWNLEAGEGYAPPVVCRGRVLFFDREGNQARCRCLHAETGKLLWSFSYTTDYQDKFNYDGGPRASPVTDGKRVFLHGPEGMLHCLRLADGEMLWKINTFADFHIVPNFFGVGSAPVLHDKVVLMQIGGSPPGSQEQDFMALRGNQSCIVAFDQATGAVVFRTGDDLASYASPQIVCWQGKAIGLILARSGLHGFQLSDGKQIIHYPFRSRLLESVNASNVLVHQNELLLTESYAAGSTLIRQREGKWDSIWSSPPRRRDSGLACHWNTPILVDGYVYGCHGRHTNEAELRCVQWSTGWVAWRAMPEVNQEALGRGSLTYVDGHFLYLSEEGSLLLLKAASDSYQPVASWSNPRLLQYPCWAAPVLSRGLLYLRGQKSLVSLEVVPVS